MSSGANETIDRISKGFKVAGFILTLFFFLSSLYLLLYHHLSKVSLQTQNNAPFQSPIYYALLIELIFIFASITFAAFISGTFKVFGTALLVSVGLGLLIAVPYGFNSSLQTDVAFFFFIGCVWLAYHSSKDWSFKDPIFKPNILIINMVVSFLILNLLMGFSLSLLNSVPFIPFLPLSGRPADKIALISELSLLLGATLASLKPGYRTWKPLIDVFLPSVVVSLAAAISFVEFWGRINYLLFLLIAVGLLNLLSIVRRELGLVPASMALAISGFIAYEGIKSILASSPMAFYLFSPLPLAYLFIVGINPPKAFDPYELLRNAQTALFSGDIERAIVEGNTATAYGYINVFRKYGIPEAYILINSLLNGYYNTVLWMMDNLIIDYRQLDADDLRRVSDFIMNNNVLPSSAGELLEALAAKDKNYAEMFARYILSTGVNDIRAQKARQVLARLHGKRQRKSRLQQQIKAPPLDQWNPELWVGRELYGYKVTKVLGIGGTSYVLEGTRGNERYAIKVAKLSSAQKDLTRASLNTFVDLSKEYSKLQDLSENSDAIVRIYGAFIDVNTIKSIESGETYYYLSSPPAIVMELMEGGTLNDLIKRSEILFSQYWPEAVKLIFLRIAYALEFIHNPKLSGISVGYVHLDVKPQNIFFKIPPGNLGEEVLENLKQGKTTVKLGDLGSARRIGEKFFEYTPQYCSIDQVEAMITGKGAQPSMDVYAFGSSLYTALTGTIYNTLEVIKLMDNAVDRLITGSGDALELINKAKAIYVNEYGKNLGNVPEGFRQVILATTHPDPAKRPSMREVIEMLKKI
ncbi:MAG: protein kinase [Sulfolobaceae archaeon]|nr:protein kinase [Sulfolobaceae archaeon]